MKQLATANDRILVGVGAPLHEFATVQTRLDVRRYDADQTRWAAERLGITSPRVLSRDEAEWDLHVSESAFDQLGVQAYSHTFEENCNLITTAGWAALLGSAAGTSIATKFSATSARIGVGTVSTAATSADTKLGGDTGSASTTSYYALVSSAPVITTTATPCTLVFTASFATGVANFAWAEFGTDNYTASSVYGQGAVFLNHGISSQGTKASGQTWTVTETLSFGYPYEAGGVN
jgi:hypothetical protein